jgi:hypothetical protein
MLAFGEGLTMVLLKRTKLTTGKSLLAVLKIQFQFMLIANPTPLNAFGVSPVPPSVELLSTVPIVTDLPNDQWVVMAVMVLVMVVVAMVAVAVTAAVILILLYLASSSKRKHSNTLYMQHTEWGKNMEIQKCLHQIECNNTGTWSKIVKKNYIEQ